MQPTALPVPRPQPASFGSNNTQTPIQQQLFKIPPLDPLEKIPYTSAQEFISCCMCLPVKPALGILCVMYLGEAFLTMLGTFYFLGLTFKDDNMFVWVAAFLLLGVWSALSWILVVRIIMQFCQDSLVSARNVKRAFLLKIFLQFIMACLATIIAAFALGTYFVVAFMYGLPLILSMPLQYYWYTAVCCYYHIGLVTYKRPTTQAVVVQAY